MLEDSLATLTPLGLMRDTKIDVIAEHQLHFFGRWDAIQLCLYCFMAFARVYLSIIHRESIKSLSQSKTRSFYHTKSRHFATATMTDPSKYLLNHTMLRVKDPKLSVKFYEFLGMSLVNTMKRPESKFDLYFLAYDSPTALSHGKHWTDRQGIIELTHNYGTEDDAEYTVNSGNKEPFRGFGHVCVSVDNIQAACKRLEDEGYGFQKKVRYDVRLG
jgi:lactoylglutathione lyase